MLHDCFLPKSTATQVKWSDAFDEVQIEKGEEPMKFFSRVDKGWDILASRGVPKSVGEGNRKLARVLTADDEVEQTLLYRNEISRGEIESIVKYRHLRLPVSTGGNVNQAFLTSGQGSGTTDRKRNNREPHNSNSSNSGNSSNGTSNSSNNSRTAATAVTGVPAAPAAAAMAFPSQRTTSEWQLYSLLRNRAALAIMPCVCPPSGRYYHGSRKNNNGESACGPASVMLGTECWFVSGGGLAIARQRIGLQIAV